MFSPVGTVHVILLLGTFYNLCIAKSHYDVLGISATAGTKIITKKYRELAKKYHPDKNKHDPGAQNMFIELSKAYEVLKNKDSRRDYDRRLKFGGSEEHNDQPTRWGTEGFHNFNQEDVFVFRTPDGKVFTTPAWHQFPGSDQKHFRDEENTFTFDFGEFPQPSLLDVIYYITMGITMGVGFFLFFLVTGGVQLCLLFPDLALFLALLLIIVVSSTLFLCCCRKKSKREKVKPKYNDAQVKEMIAKFISKEEVKLPFFEVEMMSKSRICVVSLTADSGEHCATVLGKYRRDPLHFSLSPDIGSSLSKRQGEEERGEVVAVYGCGLKWAVLSAWPCGDDVQLDSRDSSSQASDETAKAMKLAHLDSWLTQILDGNVKWNIATDSSPIPLNELQRIRDPPTSETTSND